MSASLMADTLYKSTDGSGRVTYADKPLPGAVKVERVLVESIDPENAARIEVAREKSRREAKAFQQRERQHEPALDKAHAEVITALEALKKAQRRREVGAEPLPGERLGKVGGGSRLAPSYFERQKALDREVSAAQQRLERANARHNKLR